MTVRTAKYTLSEELQTRYLELLEAISDDITAKTDAGGVPAGIAALHIIRSLTYALEKEIRESMDEPEGPTLQ